jgi:probable phosphoglycerate mutase
MLKAETMTATELIVVRHGETLWNSQSRIQGHHNSELTEAGFRQARAIAKRLSRTPFDILYSSDLKRALQTAQCIAEPNGHEIKIEPRLRERNMGIFEGLTREEILEKCADEYAHIKVHSPTYSIPGGESLQEVYNRITTCFREIVDAQAGKRIVAVTHGGVLDSLIRFVMEIPLSAPRKFRLFNAGLNTFFIRDGVWMLGTWGDVSHLTDLSALDHWH